VQHLANVRSIAYGYTLVFLFNIEKMNTLNLSVYLEHAADPHYWKECFLSNELNEDDCDCGNCCYYGLFVNDAQHSSLYKYGNVQICELCFQNLSDSIQSQALRGKIREDFRINGNITILL